jgi:transposase
MCAPNVKAQKNDDLDAAAIAEAASRPTMRFVEVKSQAQSDIQARIARANGWCRSAPR